MNDATQTVGAVV